MFDPVFLVTSAVVFILWIILVLCVFFTTEGKDRMHDFALFGLGIVFCIAIAAPWVLAAFGHFLFSNPPHAHYRPSLHPLLCVFYGLVGELWFFQIGNMEAGIYCSFLSVVGALLGGIIHAYLLLLLGPIFLMECGLIVEEVKSWREHRREQVRRE